jgi:sugar phosphate isomerase/epimerase
MYITTRCWSLTIVTLACMLGGVLVAGAADDAPQGASPPNPFYAYCVGIGTDPQSASLSVQLKMAPMLAELGYAGTAHVGLAGAMEMIEALESRGQKLFAVYSPLELDPGQPGYDAELKRLLPKLKGHGTLVWLVVNSKTHKSRSTDGDDRAVELIREIADLAKEYGVAVSLYPHVHCYAERMEDVVRLAKKADRPNVGVTFTFCHFLAVDDAKNIDHALDTARPYLQMVTINGTSGYDPKDFGRWIQVLGEGSFDMATVLRSLRRIDYRGPVGIIAYGIKGDHRDILARSIKAWKALSVRIAAEPK